MACHRYLPLILKIRQTVGDQQIHSGSHPIRRKTALGKITGPQINILLKDTQGASIKTKNNTMTGAKMGPLFT